MMSKVMIHGFKCLIIVPVFTFGLASCGLSTNQPGQNENSDYKLSGSKVCWQPITIQFYGPETSEDQSDNPFLNYRLNVLFSHEGDSLLVPGYYAADGNAAESSADSGNVWEVKFTPNKPGTWNFSVSFRKDSDIAVKENPEIGTPLAFDGTTGEFVIDPIDRTAPGFLGQGKISYANHRYLKFAGSDDYFLKGGAGSPENLLAFEDFDGTEPWGVKQAREGEAATITELHKYTPHIEDWNSGDPSWQNGKGKGLIGALNYLSSKGMNSVYFLTLNINGDGKDVWPYTGYDQRLRFDCSKLAQWEVVFSHMDRLGLLLHVVLQETENETLLDEGDTHYERKLYYRELIARFGHHLGIIWNMGEENGPVHWSPDGQNTEQRKAMVRYFSENDPYNSLRVIHSHADEKPRREIFSELLDDPNMEGISMQIGSMMEAHDETRYWVEATQDASNPWVVSIDEIGHASRGVDPDDRTPNNQDSVRSQVLWGNLMAGGAGVEWYFGYQNHNNDLACEDWRSREMMWNYTRIALEFFQQEVPFWEMHHQDELISSGNGWCLAKEKEVYLIYLPIGGPFEIDLTGASGNFVARWFNPRTGNFFEHDPTPIESNPDGPTRITLPSGIDQQDWVVLIQKFQNG